jgi:PAS domain S-box-containing protein
MESMKNSKVIILYVLGLCVLFGVCIFFGFPPAIIKALFLLTLMSMYYLNYELAFLLIYGSVGLGLIGAVGFIGSDIKTAHDYMVWFFELLLYSGVYGLFLLFSLRLKRLKEISTLHELVIAGTTAGLWKWNDMSKDEQWWSPRYYQLLGYENNEIAATLTNLGELIHPDDRALAFQVLQDYIAGKRPDLEFEYRIRTKSGAYKWFLGSGEVQFEKDKRKAIRVVGSIVNIDHKKQYELALANQAALVALSPDAIITTDPDLNVLSWNPGAEKLYDITASDAVGRNVNDLIISSYPYSTESEVISQFQTNGTWRGEAYQVTKKGRKVYVLSSVQMIKDTLGSPNTVMAVNRDLSLLRVNKELNAALKMVENSTQYLEQLAYVSSHDLKSPIITLQGLMNHLASSKAIVPGYEATFEMIREIVEQMKSTSVSLSSILQLRKNLTSREFATDRVSVSQVARDVLDMLKASIDANGAQISVNVEKGLNIRIHHTFLKAILFNLVSNSLKFRPGRLPVVSITAAAEGNNMIISVSDNGTGINLARYQNRLFAIFTRFHDGIEGNGIGLHSVKMIVDFYKGEINIESEEGTRTNVIIKLPIEPDGEN